MTQALATKPKAATVSDKGTLEHLMANASFQTSLQTVLPKHLTPERVVKMALVAASRQPLLYKCTQASILQSIMKAAELGLDCSGTLGRAYLVPYFNSKIGAYEAQFLVGYQGLIELARRSGNIARIESRVVYANDQFTVEYGLDQKLVHKPSLNGDRGKLTCVYAVAELTDGSRQIEVMTLDEVESIRSRSKAKDSGPWKTDYSEMARKTVIRRIAKYLPLSTELQKAFEADDAMFNTQHDVEDMAARTKATAESLREQLTVVEPVAELPESFEDEMPNEPSAESDGDTPESDIEVEETPAPKMSKAESQKADHIAAIQEIEQDDPERVAIALDGRSLESLSPGQVKDIYLALTK